MTRPEDFSVGRPRTPLEHMEAKAFTLGDAIRNSLPPGIGYALIVFHFGESIDNWLSYSSNANRIDLIATLREVADKLESMGGR